MEGEGSSYFCLFRIGKSFNLVRWEMALFKIKLHPDSWVHTWVSPTARTLRCTTLVRVAKPSTQMLRYARIKLTCANGIQLHAT